MLGNLDIKKLTVVLELIKSYSDLSVVMADKDATGKTPSSPTPSVLHEIPSGQRHGRWDVNAEGNRTSTQSVDG